MQGHAMHDKQKAKTAETVLGGNDRIIADIASNLYVVLDCKRPLSCIKAAHTSRWSVTGVCTTQ